MPFTAISMARSGCVGEHLLERLGLHVADRAGVPVVDLVLQLAAGDADLLGVDHDDEVAGIDVRGVDGLVLAAQPMGQGRGQAAQRLAFGVHEVPVTPDGIRLGGECFHAIGPRWSRCDRPKRRNLTDGRQPTQAERPAGGNLLYNVRQCPPRRLACHWARAPSPTWADRLIGALDQGLRALAAPAAATRPSPAAGLARVRADGRRTPAERGADAGESCRRDRGAGLVHRPGPAGARRSDAKSARNGGPGGTRPPRLVRGTDRRARRPTERARPALVRRQLRDRHAGGHSQRRREPRAS